MGLPQGGAGHITNGSPMQEDDTQAGDDAQLPLVSRCHAHDGSAMKSFTQHVPTTAASSEPESYPTIAPAAPRSTSRIGPSREPLPLADEPYPMFERVARRRPKVWRAFRLNDAALLRTPGLDSAGPRPRSILPTPALDSDVPLRRRRSVALVGRRAPVAPMQICPDATVGAQRCVAISAASPPPPTASDRGVIALP